MDENKSAVPARMTRSRRASVESPVASPARKTRTRKPKTNTENETGSVGRRISLDDFDDAASNASSSSLKACKVVLRRENFDEIDTNANDTEDRSVVAHSTRARRSSQLTEENISAAYSNAPRRSFRTGSVISDGTESTQVSRPRSTRLAQSQNTPKTDNTSRPSTPARRSSRLLSENEKAAESPAKTPARRNLRSSSVASEDLSPPRRTSTRLTESQGTPKSLKTKVSKIKTEPTTPSRTSIRMNKSVIADVIDEEPSDEESAGIVQESTSQSKQAKKANENRIEEETESIAEAEVIGSDTSKNANQTEQSEEMIINDEPEPNLDIKPILTDEQKSAAKVLETSSIVLLESSFGSPVSKSPSEPMSPVVLVSTTTISPKPSMPLRKAQTPTVEPAEPMETSITEMVEQTATPKSKSPKIAEKSIIQTPQINSPKTTSVSSDLDSMDVTGMVNESILSPAPTKSKESRGNSNVSMAINDAIEVNKLNKDKPALNDSRVESKETNDLESMAVDETAPNTDNGESKQKVVYSNKVLESVKRAEASTPKRKQRTSQAFESLDDSTLVQEDESLMPTPTMSKKSSKRQSLNDTVQSTGFDRMEVSILAEESTRKAEKFKSGTPKVQPKGSPITKGSSDMEISPKSKTPQTKESNNQEGSSDMEISPKSSAKTPQTVKRNNQEDEKMSDDEYDSSATPKLFRGPRKSSFGGMSLSLTEEVNKLLASLETSVANKESNDRPHEIGTPDIDTRIDDIAAAITPVDVEVTNRRFAEIAADLTPATSNDDEQQGTDIDKVQEDTIHESDKKSDKDTSLVNTTQQPDMDLTSTIKPSNVSVSKNERKSVQIITPVVEKSQKMGQKRIDTPYPDDKSISEATANNTKSDERKKKREETRAEARENLKKLSESWNKSIKRNSFTDKSPKPIDALGVADTSSKPDTPKVAVPARNNWKKDIVDNESELESENELVPESDEEGSSDYEEEDSESDEFVDAEAEVIDNYESGDSMDEEERREIEENRIEEGMDIGSSDTDGEDEDDDYEDDGFIIDDSELVEASDSEESEEEIEVKPKRKNSRIIEPSSSEEESDSESTSNSNDIISVPVEQIESVILIHGNPSSDAEVLIEGKTFPTTYLMPVEEDEVKSPKVTKKTALTDVAKVDGEPETMEIQQENEATPQAVQSIESATVSNVNESVRENQQEANVLAVKEATSLEKCDDTIDSDKITQKNQNDTEKVNGKENQMTAKKTRISLPGIDRLPKSSIVKKKSRVSLGDLNADTHNVSVTQFTAESSKPKASTKIHSQNKAKSTNNEITEDEASVANVSLSLNESNAPLDVSSQEENNNGKAAKKDKIISQIHLIVSDEIIPSEEVVQVQVEAPASVEGQDGVTSTSVNESAIKPKPKRKFIEMDIDEEVHERAKPKKVLRIINSASGKFIEEPMTPEKNNHGFRVTPRTPVNQNFYIQKRVQVEQTGRPNKRKSIYLDEDEDIDLLLPKPKWQINTQFDEEQPKKRARKLDLGSTEVILKPLEPKKKKKQFVLVPVELTQFRHNILHRAGIPRQNSRALLRRRALGMAYK